MNLDGDKASDAIGKFLDMLGESAQAPSFRAPPRLGTSEQQALRGRKSKLESPPISPMPVSPRMVRLRNLAEDMHARWAAGDRAVPEERLGMASRSDLGILCGLLIDCAHPMERRALVSWLEASLSEERLGIISYDLPGGWLEDEKFFSTSAKSGKMRPRSSSAREASAENRIIESIRISVRLIILGEAASQLQTNWLEGDRGAVRKCLNESSRIDLGILCSLMNEREHPLRRPELMNWLEANLANSSRVFGGAPCK